MKAAIGIVAFALFVVAAPRAPLGSGAHQARLATARALVHGTLDVAATADPPATCVRHGRRFAVEPPGAALALVPAEAIASTFNTRADRAARWAECATAALAAALVCVLFFAGARRLGASARASLAMTAALAVATQLFIAARVPDGSALGALLLLAAVQSARATSGAQPLRAALALGAAGGAAALVDGAYALPALVAVLAAAVRQLPDRARATRVALPAVALVAAGAGATLAHALAIGWDPPPGDLAEGLVGLLLSTGKNIFLYSPPLALAPLGLALLWRARRADAALTLAVCAALLVALARTHDWHGDPAWGPRRALPLVPLALEPAALWLDGAARAARRVLVPALIALGLFVQVVGAALAPTEYLRVLTVVRSQTGAPLWFSPAPSQAHFMPPFSPLLGNAWLLWHLARGDRDGAHDAPWRQLVPGTPRLEAEWARLRIDWWPLDASPARR